MNNFPTHVIVKTKSNFRNLNGKLLLLTEVVGRRVSVTIADNTPQGHTIVDFTLSEVVEFVK